MEANREVVPEGREGMGDRGPGPALPSRRDVILVVLFFLVVTFGIRHVLIPILSSAMWRYLGPGDIASSAGGSFLASWLLDLSDNRAALLASVLLYFPIVRRKPPGLQRERRGEILTGLVNLHILVLAVALPLASQLWTDINPLYVGSMVLSYVVSTAFWCLVGFHLCEGRYLMPLGGIFIWFLQSGFSIFMYLLPVPAWGGLMILAPVLGLVWELWFLIRAGSGFEIFPTGLWPAVRRCARVFLFSAATFWLLGWLPWFLMAGVQNFYRLAGFGMYFASIAEIPIAYLVPIFLLGWPDREMARRSRKLTLVLLGIVALGPILCVPLILLLHYGPIWGFSSFGGGLFSLILFPLWMVFVPISIYRWWVRGNFLRPLLVASLGICFAGMLTALLGMEPRALEFAYILGRVLVILLAVPLLFLRIPPPAEESWEDGSRGDSPASPARD